MIPIQDFEMASLKGGVIFNGSRVARFRFLYSLSVFYKEKAKAKQINGNCAGRVVMLKSG